MNFSEAFKYPYNNLPRVLMITLAFAAYTMVITIFFALILDNFSESSIITHSWIVGTSELLFVGGYGVRLIRSVIHGEEIAPRLKVVEDIGHGIRIFLAFISYTIPLILMYLFSVAVRSITYRTLTREATIVIGGLSLVALALVIPLIFLLGWASQVAMFRYAVKKSGLFEFGTNIRIARQNQGPAFSLSVGLLVLTIVYAIFSYIVNSIYQHAVGLMMPLHTPSQVMLLTIGYILASPFSIISQFSGLHLLAQFGMKIGLGPEKPKPTDPDTDHNEEQNVSDLDTD